MPKANRPRNKNYADPTAPSPTWFEIPPLELEMTERPDRYPDNYNDNNNNDGYTYRSPRRHNQDLSQRQRDLDYESDRFRTWSPVYEHQPVFHHPPTPRHHRRRQNDRQVQTQRDALNTDRPYRPPHFGYTEREPDRYTSAKMIYRPNKLRELLVSERRPRGSGCRHCRGNQHHHQHHHHDLRKLHRFQYYHKHHPARHKHHHHRHDKVYYTTGGNAAVKWEDDYDEDDDRGRGGGDDESSCCSECCCCQSDSARVRLFSQDGFDPYSCTCFPKKSSHTIPAMMYDGVRCPHPEHQYPPGKQDIFVYPWSVQSYRPQKALEYGYRQGQIKPPSAVTAPPFATYDGRKKGTNYNPRDPDPLHLPPIHPLPNTAPAKPTQTPLLASDPSDRRLRRADRARLEAALQRIEEEGDADVSPFDSVSQVTPSPLPLRHFRPPSLRLRTVDEPIIRRADSELRALADSRQRALGTPRGRPLLDDDGFPQTPTRIFRGEYADPNNGKLHEYNIKYGKKILGGTKSLRTV